MADKDKPERGFLRGLQNYGDRDFSIYMRRAFAKSMGYTGEELEEIAGRARSLAEQADVVHVQCHYILGRMLVREARRRGCIFR